VGAVATVAAHVRDPDADAQWLGGAEAAARRLARGREALCAYEATGEAEYVPAVDADRADVGMPGRLPWSWYQPWADTGRWENRYAVMSDAAVMAYEGLSAFARLTKPYLMIHGDQCAIPDGARRHFAAVPTPDKRLIWRDTPHLRYYDDPVVIGEAAEAIAAWYTEHLPPLYAHRPAESATGRAETVRRFFDLLGKKDIDAWAELWAEDGRVQIPYPPDGFDQDIVGRARIHTEFKRLFANYETFESDLTGVYPAADSDAVCVEYTNRATLTGGAEYTNDNIAVFRFRNGLISEYHDYFDPRRFQAVIDALG
jgi:ketosteroid isomerase-like protein